MASATTIEMICPTDKALELASIPVSIALWTATIDINESTAWMVYENVTVAR
jgi:hypothetical protein